MNLDATPEQASRVLDAIERNLAVVRRRAARPLALSEKVLLGHLDDPARAELEPGASELFLRVDRVVFQDVLGQTGLLQFMPTSRTRVAVPTSRNCDPPSRA